MTTDNFIYLSLLFHGLTQWKLYSIRARGSKLSLLRISDRMAFPNFALKKPSANVYCLLLSLITFFCFCIPSHAKISYEKHCSDFVPQTTFSGRSLDTSNSVYIYISSGYFSGGGKILRSDSLTSSSELSVLPGHFSFYTNHIYSTHKPGVLHLTGHLSIQSRANSAVRIRSSHSPRIRHRFYQDYVNFELSGFWSNSSGKLCMVGRGSTWAENGTSLYHPAVFTLNYPEYSNISTSIVSGTLRSLDTYDSPTHFDNISVLGYAQNKYDYTETPKVRDACSRVTIPSESLGFETTAVTNYLQILWRGEFQLEYGRDCPSANCGPFSNEKSLEFLPTFMTMNVIHISDDGKVHMHIGFTNSSGYDYNNFLIPGKSLSGEGYWDQERKLLCLLACPVLEAKNYAKDSSVGECSIGLSFWFPAFFTIKDRSNVVGRIWSVKVKSDPGYFNTISFRSLGSMDILPGAKYIYTEVDSLRKTCESTKGNKSGSERYPDENSIEDLRFDFSARDGNKSMLWGYGYPLSFGEIFYGNSFSRISSEVSFIATNKNASRALWNVSYIISFYNSYVNTELYSDIAAEGVYNARTGILCMVGCKTLITSKNSAKGKIENSEDCQIQINIQLSPLDDLDGSISRGKHLNGTIRSTREQSDPLYFNPLELSSYTMYTTEARETVWRMDMEITMAVISLTLSCIFITLQIFHVRKHQDVIPSISFTMLVILTLGHMVPLVLNFEALFMKNGRSAMLWSGGWLEVKEVTVRVMTMIAFLLQFRLLQLAWTLRSLKEGRKGLWVVEMKALLFCLPLYLSGAAVAWLLHSISYKTQEGRMIWDDLISFVGLVLDGFLLPQIILNIILNSKDKVLAPLFYIGTTAVRALPHLYDAYRARNFVPYLKFSYIYASPYDDYYSTAWDIIIPFGGVLLTVLIFLQQKFGGNCFLPKRFRNPGGYETVPVIDL